MSSRPSPPSQPDRKSRLYQASAAPPANTRTAANQLPPFGPNTLPSPSSILGSGPPLSPPSHLQPVYIPPSPQMRLGYSDFAAQHRSLNPFHHPHPQSQPPSPQNRIAGQGVAPLTRILHASPYTPSASNSPSSPLYPSQTFNSLPFQGSPYEVVKGHRLTDQARPSGNPSPYAAYQHRHESAGIYQSSTASPDSVATAPNHVGRSLDLPQRPLDITDRYNLTIRQQPIAARACGFGERDRRVIDPPPIVQLSLRNFDPSLSSDVSELRWPFNVVHCALLSTPSQSSTIRSTADVTSVADPNNANKMSRRLMGTLVASPFLGIDPDTPALSDANARLGCFFVFPDLSCRQNGLYRLRFTLMKVNVEMTPTGGRSSIVGAVESDIFEVFSAKDFPGMRASTALTKELKKQGAAVSVKKGNEAKAGKKGKKRGSTMSKSDSDASDSGTGAGSSTKKKIKD